MKKLLLFLILMSQFLFPQLKEMEVKPSSQQGGIPVNRDNPEKAAIFFYTQFDDLSFWSNYGIVDIKGDPTGGKYIVIVEPVRQTIEVRRKGFKTEMIKIESLQPRDVLYYEVIPKKDEGITGVTEVGITVQVTPTDAEISIDGVPVKHDHITPLKLGKHTLSVSKSGYRPYTSDIEVSPTNTFFKVTLEQVKLAQVQILSMPQGAEIRVNGDMKGVTDKGLFLFPGDYELSLSKDEYLPVNQNITVSGDEQKNKFTYNLVKNRGNLELTIQPSGTTLKINGQLTEYKTRFELPPGEYTIEVSKELYLPFTESIKIERGKTVTQQIELFKNRGNLELTIQPSGTTLKINGQLTEYKTRFELPPGEYSIEVSKELYLPFTETVVINRGETIKRKVSLTQNYGTIKISTTPTEATLKLNGMAKPSSGQYELLPGIYIVELSADKFLSRNDTILLKSGEVAKKNYSLLKNRGKIALTVLPSNAVVKLNGERITDYRNIEVKPGNYSLDVTADQHLTFSEKIEIGLGTMIKRDIKLVKNTGRLSLKTVPNDAIILVNKERQNTKEIEQAPGLYEVTVKKETYKDQTFTIEIKKGDLIRREIKLEAITGSLQFAVSPLKAKVMLEREGKQVESWKGMRIIDKARIGEYNLTVELEGYKTIKKGLSILENRTTIEDIQMITGDSYVYHRIEPDEEFTDGLDDLKSDQSIEEIKKDTKVEIEKDTKVEIEKDNKEEVLNFAEEMPSFPGGDGALYAFLAQNIQYPEKAKRAGVEGQVIVMFTVLKTGQVASPRVVRGIGGGCDEEALRVVMMMARWNPGKEKGQPVNVHVTVPIRFQLQ